MPEAPRCARHLRRAALAAPALVLAACTGQVSLEVDSEVPSALVSERPLDVGVHYEPAFREHVYTEQSADRPDWSIASGASQVALFDRVLDDMFARVSEVQAVPPPGGGAGLDGVIEPHIEEMQFATPRETSFEFYEAWIKYRIRLYEPDGDLITEWIMTAYGKSPTGFLSGDKDGLNKAMEVALRDAGAKFAVGFPDAPGVSEWLTSKSKAAAGPASG